MTRKLSDIKLQDSHNGIPKGRVFQKDNKFYKILGFELTEFTTNVYAVRILKTTFKTSPKQPLFEVFDVADTLDQKIKCLRFKTPKFVPFG